MYAVIRTGGKQYRVAKDDVVRIEKLAGEPGDSVTFDQVVLLGGEDGTTVGAPVVEGASVEAEVVEPDRQAQLIGAGVVQHLDVAVLGPVVVENVGPRRRRHQRDRDDCGTHPTREHDRLLKQGTQNRRPVTPRASRS